MIFPRRSGARLRAPLAVAALSMLLVTLAGAQPAFSATPWWKITTQAAPSHLPPEGAGEIVVEASNLGAAPVEASKSPVVITDELPAALTATSITSANKAECSLATVQCTFKGTLAPYTRVTVTIKVKVDEPEGTVASLPNTVSVQAGGGAAGATSTQQLTVSGEPAPFGAQSYEFGLFNESGTPAVQAGSHPFQLTTTLTFNQILQGGLRVPVAMPKDLRFDLPPGLVGDPDAVTQCSLKDFNALVLETNLCSPSSVVGVATITGYEVLQPPDFTRTVPVFNLVPGRGEPARFGFVVIGKVPIVIDTSVRTGGDYNVTASVTNATTTAGLLSSQVTLWGVPGAPEHNQSRGWECVAGGAFRGELEEIENKERPCPAANDLPQTPFLTLPGSCPASPASEPLSFPLQMDSWTEPASLLSVEDEWLNAGGEPLGMEGCAGLPFTPTIQVTPEEAHAPPVHDTSTPTGLSVNVHVPQRTLLEANPNVGAEADVRGTTVTLPAGVQLNPAAANGLAACPEQPEGGIEGVGFEGFQKFYGAEREPLAETATFTPTFRFSEETAESGTLPPSCPEASKVGIVHIRTPLLPNELEGAVYLAEPAPNGEANRNPFDSLIALYLVAEDREAGILVKLAGKGELDQSTGRVSTTFSNTPQLPFEELKLETFGGPRAALSTPAFCGSPATEALFTPWSGTAPVAASSPLEITSGVGGSTCPPDPLLFTPGFDAQSTVTRAGAFSPFTLELERPDGQQALTGVTLHLPPGVAALLSSVTPCPEPPAGQEWSCGEQSLIGHSTAWSGLGEEPVQLAGDVYLTTGYDGAPFGLLVRTLAKAGPFDLGYVNVRSRIDVNPETAAVTVTTDPGPHGDALITMLKGIPVQLKRLQVTVDRPDFEFNPTSCEPMAIAGTLSGSEGASASVSSRFQVGGCENLPFHPDLTASVGGHASKADGTTFDVDVTSQGLGVANIRKVELQIPAQLPSRQTTLNQACLAATFQTNPASCPEGSVIGTATVDTPVLKSPLSGPAYLVSYGNAKFPDVEFVLQGEGITIVLDGHTDIKDGVTYSRFETAPDAPFTTFETSLPAGPHGILTAYASEKEPYELCAAKLTMPTTITAQDGAVIQENTAVTPTGCGGVLAKKTSKPTRAEQLVKALASCRHKYHSKKAKPRRIACEAQARKRYGPIKKKTAHKARKATPRS